MTSSILFAVGTATNALQENTPAILWLYTRDLKSFVSRKKKEFNRAQVGQNGCAASPGSRERSCKTPQNAGCKMAIHAYCTKLKIQ